MSAAYYQVRVCACILHLEASNSKQSVREERRSPYVLVGPVKTARSAYRARPIFYKWAFVVRAFLRSS